MTGKISWLKKAVASLITIAFTAACFPLVSMASQIKGLENKLSSGSSSSNSAAAKKSNYTVTKVKTTKKTKKTRKAKKAKRITSSSNNLGDAAYESSASNKSAEMDNSGTDGTLKGKIVKSIKGLLNSTSFRGSDVQGGKVACAKVVSTALKNAGVLSKVILGVPELVTSLKNKGWKEVVAPPFKAGDVVTWKTYDRNRDGKKDNDTHVGIMSDDGKAISNSSSRRMPRSHSVYYAPICRVLRQA